MAISEKKGKEYFRALLMCITISILSAYKGWDEVLVVGLLFALILSLKRLTPRTQDDSLNQENISPVT